MTLVTHGRASIFGRIEAGRVRLYEPGRIAWEEWFRTSELRTNVMLFAEEFVVMPNHVHGVVRIVERAAPPVGAQRAAPLPRSTVTPGSLSAIVRAYKTAVTRRINRHRGTPGAPVWQRNYWDHVVRGERALASVRRYIAENPFRWHLDVYNPERHAERRPV
ncbi:transposase [Oceanithermus sp.]|uniref:transposase n=1 Tax=Oceanithermus sp. TaxID=2268145 RepID=UPI00257C8D0A|nr:transposase [Oceanithermus sp.]